MWRGLVRGGGCPGRAAASPARLRSLSFHRVPAADAQRPCTPLTPHPSLARAGFTYTLIALVAVCYWMQGNAARQEYEDSEREEASLLGGGAEAEDEAKH